MSPTSVVYAVTLGLLMMMPAPSEAQDPAAVQFLPPDQAVAPAPARGPVQVLSADPLGTAIKRVVKQEVKALRRGPLLVHGNYCGIGNRPGTVPIDALDTACMHHDACTTTGGMPSCKCDDQLRVAALAISQDPRTPPDLQVLAASTAASMVVLICK